MVPTQDIVLGVYYLTKETVHREGGGARLRQRARRSCWRSNAGQIDLLASIRLRYTGELIDLTTVRDDQDVLHTDVQDVENQLIDTTAGARDLQ